MAENSRRGYCINLISEAAGDLLSKDEAKALMDELQSRADTYAKKKLASMSDALEQSAKDLLSEKQKARAEAMRVAQIQVVRAVKLDGRMDSFRDKAKAVMSIMDGTQTNIKNAKFSVGAVQKSETLKLMGKFNSLLSKDNLHEFFKDVHNETDIAKAMLGHDDVSPQAKQLAVHVKDIYNDIRKGYYEAGGYEVPELADYIAHQSHDPVKMMSQTGSTRGDFAEWWKARKSTSNYFDAKDKLYNMAKERWLKNEVPLMDIDRAFGEGISEAEVNKILGKMYDDKVAGDHHRDAETGKTQRGGRPGWVKQRIIHYKSDGHSWVLHNKNYGQGTVQNAIVNTMETAGRDIGTMKILGPEPEEMYHRLVKKAKKDQPNVSKGGLHHADLIYREVSGQTNIPVNHVMAKSMQAIRAYLGMAKLGFVLPTSFNDVAIRASKMEEYGVGPLEAYADAITNNMSGLSPKEKKIFLDSTGLTANSMIGHPIRYMSAGDSPSGTISKAQKVYWKLTGMNWHDQFQESGASTGYSRQLAMRSGDKLSKMPTTMQRNLKLYGIEDKEWDLIRHKDNVMTPFANKKMIAPDAAKYFTEDSIKDYLGNKDASKFEVEDVRRDMETRLRTFYINETGESLIRPTAADRAWLIRGTKPGTLEGEFARSFAMFKTFSVAMTRRVGGRLMMGAEEGQKMFDMRGKDAWGMARFMVGGTILGYIGNAVKDLGRGYTPERPDSAQAFSRAFSIGALGIYGEFLVDQYNKYGQSFTGKVAGPVFGTLDDVVKTAYKIVAQDKPGMAALNTAEKLTPNLYGFHVALDYAFLDDMKESISPGYKRRLQHRLSESGQQQLFG
jgi:hypothetical protein